MLLRKTERKKLRKKMRTNKERERKERRQNNKRRVETCLYEDHVELSDVHFFFLLAQEKTRLLNAHHHKLFAALISNVDHSENSENALK